MKLDAPWLTAAATRAVIDRLEATGAPIYFVGGCVRNALLGVAVEDIDLSTPLTPDQVIEAVGETLRAIPTGIDHGTVTLVSHGQPFEVTTFRRDVATDGRRAVVAFSTRIEDDAARRDFTMNALYATPEGEIVDPLGGLPDLLARRVRFIGNADDRISEDGLRIIRFFRFHALYGDPLQGLDPDGMAAVARDLDCLNPVSRERIGAEMRKLLAAPDPAPAIAAMTATGVLPRILPGADPMALAPLVHLEGRAGIAPAWLRRLAALAPPDDTADLLRLSRAEARDLATLLSAARDGAGAAELGYRLGATHARDAILLRAAFLGQPPAPDWQQAIATGAAQTFPLTAEDLLARHGQTPALGRALAALETRWIASNFTLDRAALLALADG